MRTLRVPFQIDSRGGLAFTESSQEIVEQQIIDLLATNRFERIMNPQYGADVLGFLFSPIRDALLKTKAEEVRSLLNSTVQLADVVSVSMTPQTGTDSTLLLDVRYQISPSPTVFTLTKTITGLITDETNFGEVL